MLSKLKGVGAFALGALVLLGIMLLAFGAIAGGAWLAAKVYPIVSVISAMALALSVLVLLPMILFERTREAGASGLMMASVVFGASSGCGRWCSPTRFGAGSPSLSACSCSGSGSCQWPCWRRS